VLAGTGPFNFQREKKVEISLQQIARALNGEIRGNQVVAPGPGHSAADRSLSVKISDSSEDIVVHSFAGDDPVECKKYVRERCGLPSFKPNGNRHSDQDMTRMIQEAIASQNREPRSKPVAMYNYENRDGTLLYQVLRYQPKTFRQRRPNGKGWIWRLEDRRVVYRWPELRQFPNATIFVTEGEKDAERLWSIDLCATTVASGKWTDDCVQALAGRDCWILEDNDDTGRKKALEAAKLVHPVAKRIKIIRLPGLGEGGDVSDWLDAGHTRPDLEDVCYSTPDWEPESSSSSSTLRSESPSSSNTEGKPKQPTMLSYRRHRDANNQAPKYLVKNLLPETGVGLLSGQSGTYKSFVAIKLAGAIATGQSFAGHAIKRQGAVLIFASEGANELPIRLDALSEAEHGGRVLPIFYCGAGVRLLDRTSLASVITTAKAVAEDAQRDYRLPLTIIIFDTVIAAAQFAKSGDENDAAVGQKLMTALGEISRVIGTFVLGVDHFGKAVETGTRGTSAKEAAADVVLAVLASKSMSGEVTNPRLCVRKRRSGPAGVEYPFSIKRVLLGQDEDGEDIASLVIEFAKATAPAKDADAKWTRSLLRRILVALLADIGTDIVPFADGPKVRALRSEIVRAEFYKQYPTTDADPKKRQGTRKKAYQRAVRAAQQRELLAVRELDGAEWLWLTETQK
jgi:hypothetical protein